MANQPLPHTAIPTWSGFIYQGRVALYHILKQLNSKTENEINELVLQIDSIEDFSILKLIATGGYTPISMHQVKAVKSSLYSTYKEDFEKLEGKWTAIGLQTVEAFFHLATQNEKTKAQIEALHPNLKIYIYENSVEACSLTEIDVKIKEQIVLVLQKYNIAGHTNLTTVQLLSEILEKIVSDKVIYIHSLNHAGEAIRQAAFDNPIPLRSFLDAIKTDVTSLIQDENYFETVIKGNLNRYYDEFCINCDEDQLTGDVKVKMDKYLVSFNSHRSHDFRTFLQSIRPHKEINYRNLQEYTDLSMTEDEIKDAFFTILLAIKESNKDVGIGWLSPELKHYYPTSLTYSNTDRGRKNASERILKTAFNMMVDVPFNSDYLITSECNVDDLEACANNVSHLNTGDLAVDDGEKRNKITQWKKVSLIDLETAKNKLND
ncbi:MAG: hypothetical protein GYB55_04970 [Cytophagales bacterium]|nr:hypothetical protein [Cytophagales bacterium]